jgi:hypothetical protein
MVALSLSMVFTNKRLTMNSVELVSNGGMSRGEKRFPYSELASVKARCGMRTGSRVYHSIRVRDKQGRAATLTPDLRPASTVEALAEEIRRRMATGGM